MGENAKKRKSLWDAEEESPPKYEEWGPPKPENSWQSKSRSGWSSGDNVTGTEDLRKDNYHYKSMSPAFERRERRNNSHSPDNGRAQSHRYVGRARSRSRGRGEGRSRSRSRGRDKFRTRSRSRSRDRGSMRVQNRSRSPHNTKRDPYASGDRRASLHTSSHVCRNFAAGNCRRGSDCRFIHLDSASHRDEGHSEDNLSERLGSRPERGHISRYNDSEGPGYQSRDMLPDMHHLEDELNRNRSRGTITCRNFVKSNCRWGASCRFSHDGASGDNYDKGTRSTSFDHGQDNQATRTGKSLCEYFAAGKCYKDNCEFSHDATSRNHEIRPLDDIGEQVHQMESCPASMIKKLEEGLQEAQLQSVLNPSGPSGMLPSNPISSLVHALYGQTNPEMRVLDNYHPPDGLELNTSGNFKLPPDNSFYLDRDSIKVPMDQVNQTSTVDPELGNNDQIDEVKQQENELVEVDGKDKLAPGESKDVQENDHPGTMNLHGKVEEGSGNKDEKVMRLFKNALIEFVKEILKPIWKEGKMSREVHKTIVKKVVDKVTGAIQGEQVPKTQEKIEQYLSHSKPKITKLVQAYVERLLKNEA